MNFTSITRFSKSKYYIYRYLLYHKIKKETDTLNSQINNLNEENISYNYSESTFLKVAVHGTKKKKQKVVPYEYNFVTS